MFNHKSIDDNVSAGRSQLRAYRNLVSSPWKAVRVTVQQTDLGIYAEREVAECAREAALQQRGYLEAYIDGHPDFMHTLQPYPEDPLAPPIVREMIKAGAAVGVGPMAAVAGAVAERVGWVLIRHSSEVIVENGGDIFMAVKRPLTIGVYAGASPLSMKIGLQVDPAKGIRAVCTSSGTVGHSLSLGRADAACVLGTSCALADAAATALGNRVKSAGAITAALEWGRTIPGILGMLIVVGEKMGAWGQLEVVPI